MEFPTLQQVADWYVTGDIHLSEKFEFAHKTQLFFLFQSGTLVQNMAAQLKQHHTQEQLDSYKKYLTVIKDKFINWLETQHAIEDANSTLPKTNLSAGDIFTKSGLQKIKAILNTWSTDKVGIGFIPLIIGAVVGLAALWGVYKISQRFTTTVQDKEELLRQTQKTVQELGLTHDEAAKLLGDTQAQASAGTGIGDLIKYALLGFAAIQIIPMFTKKS